MKKVLVITCVAALLLATASMAMAAENDWLMLFRASNDVAPTYGNAGPLAQCGTTPTSLDGKDTGDVKLGTTATSVAYVGIYRPDFPDLPPLYGSDKRAPLDGNTQVWDLRVWVAPAYGFDSLRLGWYVPSTKPIMDEIGGIDYVYTVEVYGDPTGTHSGYTWSSSHPQGGTSTDPLGYLVWDATNLKMTPDEAIEGGIKVRFTAAPAAPVPEPGSMLALASGLVGMAGFAIRRRRA